jgi:hypothetical protein
MFLDDIWEGLQAGGQHFIDEMKYPLEDGFERFKGLTEGDTDKAFGNFEDTLGRHQDGMTENLVDMGAPRDDLTENSDAVMAAVFAAMFAGGAIGGSGAEGGVAGAEGGATGSGSGAPVEGSSWMDSGKEWLDTGKEWYDNFNQGSDMLDSFQSGQSDPSTAVPNSQYRSGAYTNLLSKINSGGRKNQIDPYQQIIIPTGYRF